MHTPAPAPAPVCTLGATRRGGGGAPAADPRTVADFEDVTAIPFVFARHSTEEVTQGRADCWNRGRSDNG